MSKISYFENTTNPIGRGIEPTISQVEVEGRCLFSQNSQANNNVEGHTLMLCIFLCLLIGATLLLCIIEFYKEGASVTQLSFSLCLLFPQFPFIIIYTCAYNTYIVFLFLIAIEFIPCRLLILGINAPTSQSFMNYVLLALVYGSIMIYRREALKVGYLHSSFALS